MLQTLERHTFTEKDWNRYRSQDWNKRYQQTNGGYQKTKNIYAGGQLVATLEKRGTASVIPYD